MKKGLVAAALALAVGWPAAEEKKAPKPAALGLEARAPSKQEKADFGLGDALAGRVNGTVVESVEKDGPAAAAGVKAGDVLLALDDNRLYSNDDLQDFVRASEAGQVVKALLKRAVGKKEETVELTLGAAAAATEKKIDWEFAGPAQMDEALALAKKEKKKVMVGISGAET